MKNCIHLKDFMVIKCLSFITKLIFPNKEKLINREFWLKS